MPNDKIQVLFVDDEPNILAGLRRMLRSYRGEWDMTFCESGADALRLMEESQREVVVTDMRMPGMDGAELLAEVRERWPGAARLVLSGHSDQEMTLRSVGPAHQYLSKPCEPSSLREAILSVVEFQREVSSEPTRKLVSGIEGLPTLPSVYLELVEELASSTSSVERVGKIIGRDVGLTAKILQLVNSSFFGLPVHVTDVGHAVSLLGLGVVKPLVLSTGVFRQFEQKDLGGLSLERLASHSLQVAVLARDIARAENADDETIDNAFLAGMMHDMGRLALAQACPVKFVELQQAIADGEEVLELERRLFGAGHAQVGGYLLGLWGMPTSMVEAVVWHHQPSRSAQCSFSATTAVHAAEALTENTTEIDLHHLQEIGLPAAAQRWETILEQPQEVCAG